MKCLRSHLSALTTQPARRHVTGSEQEEVIERIAEEESCRKSRRKQGKRDREGLGGKRQKIWRMNEHASGFTASFRKHNREKRVKK